MKNLINKLKNSDVLFFLICLFLLVGYGVYKTPYILQPKPKLIEIYTDRDMYILDLTNNTIYMESIGQTIEFDNFDDLSLHINQQTVKDLKSDR